MSRIEKTTNTNQPPSPVSPVEPSRSLASEQERLHALPWWQQKVASLEAESVEHQAAEERLREQLRLATLQRDVSLAFTAGGALDKVLTQCVSALARQLDAAFAGVWTLDETTQVLELQGRAGMETPLDGEHARIPLGALTIGRVAQTHTPHLSNAASADPAISEQDWARREGMVAFAGYPLLLETRVVGVMAIFARHTLTEMAGEALASVATTISLGIERHRTEEALRFSAVLLQQEQERLRFLAESMPQKIFTATPMGEVDYVNPQWMEFTGHSFEDIKDWGWTQFIHPEDGEEHIRRWHHALATEEPFALEQRFRRADGVYRWHLSRALPMRDAQGQITMWIGSNTDIDEQKQEEARKNAFFDMASHDLRTPLTAMKGNLQLAERRLKHLLATSEMPPERTRQLLEELALLLGRAQRQTEVQYRLIRDFLDVSRIQAGKLELSLASCDLVALVSELVQDHQASALSRTITLALPDTSAPVVVLADADRLGQVIGNYLTNALKYSAAPAPITVGVDVEGRNARVWVRDQGPGLSHDQQQRIWERFYQVPDVVVQSGAGQGMGLGLHICQTLITHQDGKVGVESTPGAGSTFWFYPASAGSVSTVDAPPSLGEGTQSMRSARH